MAKKIVNTFKLGADPEIFLADINGQLRAACGLIGGSKRNPTPLTQLGDGYAVQEDNVAVEFNIPPADTQRAFTEAIARAVKYIGDGVNNGLGLHLVFDKSAASFPDSELTSPAAKEFGCDPDFNAWTGERNPRPRSTDPNLRSCGGHVHIGYDVNGVPFNPQTLIRNMDLFLGVPSVLMDEGELRRNLYGKRGAYREKAYGVEYRTLSNFWISSPRLTQWVWDNTERAFHAAEAQFDVSKYGDAIQAAIDNNDKGAAMELIKEHALEVI